MMQIQDNRFRQQSQQSQQQQEEEPKFFNGYGEWGNGYVVSKTERSILSELEKYQLPEEIKNQADVIYSKMKKRVRRGKIRLQMLFFCTYCAYLELNRDINETELGAQFGLNSGDVQKCDSLFSPMQTGYSPPCKKISPLSYLTDYCKQIGLTDDVAVNQILTEGTEIMKKDPGLHEDNPKTVAAGILRYYLVTYGIVLSDNNKLTKVTCRSNATIDSMYKRIATAVNN